MRFVLLIPVLVLFLSNVPFIHEMPMEQMMAMMQEDEEKCCKKEARKGSCHADSKPEIPNNEPANGCCQPSETTCHCICCFQFAAPANEITPLQFGLTSELAFLTGFVASRWKDPHIASPGQPPDFA